MNDAELEAALSQMRPRSSQVQRDHVMYRAGRVSQVNTSRRGWLRSSTTAAGWLLAAGFCGLWMQLPEPVIVTKIQYIERAEPTPVQRTAALATDTGGPANTESPTPASRVRLQGRGDNLDTVLALNLSRSGRIPAPASTHAINHVSERADPVGERSSRSDSYRDLMKIYLNPSRAGFHSAEQL